GDGGGGRSGGALDARRPGVLRVSRAAAPELAEVLQVVERDGRSPEDLVVGVDGLHAGQVQERVEEGGRVSRREYEAIPIRPDRIVGVEVQEPLPQAV